MVSGGRADRQTPQGRDRYLDSLVLSREEEHLCCLTMVSCTGQSLLRWTVQVESVNISIPMYCSAWEAGHTMQGQAIELSRRATISALAEMKPPLCVSETQVVHRSWTGSDGWIGAMQCPHGCPQTGTDTQTTLPSTIPQAVSSCCGGRSAVHPRVDDS